MFIPVGVQLLCAGNMRAWKLVCGTSDEVAGDKERSSFPLERLAGRRL